MEKVKQSDGFDGATALDANEVKALFAQLRTSPQGVSTIQQTFDRLRDRL